MFGGAFVRVSEPKDCWKPPSADRNVFWNKLNLHECHVFQLVCQLIEDQKFTIECQKKNIVKLTTGLRITKHTGKPDPHEYDEVVELQLGNNYIFPTILNFFEPYSKHYSQKIST